MENPVLKVVELFGGQLSQLEGEISRLTAEKRKVEQTLLAVLGFMTDSEAEVKAISEPVVETPTPEVAPEVKETPRPEFPARAVYLSQSPAARNVVSELVTELFETDNAYTVLDICKELGIEPFEDGKQRLTKQAQQVANRVSYLKTNGILVKIGVKNGYALMRKARENEVDSEHILQRKYHGRTPTEEILRKKKALIEFLKSENLTKFNARVVVNRVEAANRKDLKFGTTVADEASRMGALLWRMSQQGMLKNVKKGLYALI